MDAKTGANTKSGKLSVGDQNWPFPIREGTIGPNVVASRTPAHGSADPGGRKRSARA